MNFKEYQEAAYEFAMYDDLVYPLLGLTEEVGELMTYFAKISRGDEWTEEEFDQREGLAQKEVGDILWMLAAICSDNDWDMDAIARSNISKLTARRITDKILGDGDTR